MKKILLLTVFFSTISLFFISCDDGGYLGPVEYNNQIIGYYNSLDSTIIAFVQDVYNKEATVADLQEDYDKTLELKNKNMLELKKIKVFSDDPGFYNSTITFHQICDDVLKNEFSEIIDIYSSGDWTDAKSDKVDELTKEGLTKVSKQENKVIETEDLFATKYDISLPEE